MARAWLILDKGITLIININELFRKSKECCNGNQSDRFFSWFFTNELPKVLAYQRIQVLALPDCCGSNVTCKFNLIRELNDVYSTSQEMWIDPQQKWECHRGNYLLMYSNPVSKQQMSVLYCWLTWSFSVCTRGEQGKDLLRGSSRVFIVRYCLNQVTTSQESSVCYFFAMQ